MINITLFVDIIMVFLLAATIGFAIVLNQRIKTIDENKEHLKQLLQGFSSSLLAAERCIQTLNQTSQKTTELVGKNFEEAKQLREDLEMLTERGTKIADIIEKAIRAGRHINISEREQKKQELHPVASSKQKNLLQKEDEKNTNIEKNELHDVKKQLFGSLKTLR